MSKNRLTDGQQKGGRGREEREKIVENIVESYVGVCVFVHFRLSVETPLTLLKKLLSGFLFLKEQWES